MPGLCMLFIATFPNCCIHNYNHYEKNHGHFLRISFLSKCQLCVSMCAFGWFICCVRVVCMYIWVRSTPLSSVISIERTATPVPIVGSLATPIAAISTVFPMIGASSVPTAWAMSPTIVDRAMRGLLLWRWGLSIFTTSRQVMVVCVRGSSDCLCSCGSRITIALPHELVNGPIVRTFIAVGATRWPTSTWIGRCSGGCTVLRIVVGVVVVHWVVGAGHWHCVVVAWWSCLMVNFVWWWKERGVA